MNIIKEVATGQELIKIEAIKVIQLSLQSIA